MVSTCVHRLYIVTCCYNIGIISNEQPTMLGIKNDIY